MAVDDDFWKPIAARVEAWERLDAQAARACKAIFDACMTGADLPEESPVFYRFIYHELAGGSGTELPDELRVKLLARIRGTVPRLERVYNWH